MHLIEVADEIVVSFTRDELRIAASSTGEALTAFLPTYISVFGPL